MLAQGFGVERNHQYVYGWKVVLWSDHKPLETIYKKPLAAAPKRLQRMFLRLQQCDVEIRCKPGPEMHLADTLSRAYLPTTVRSPAEQETERIHTVDFLPYFMVRDELSTQDGILFKGLRCVIPVSLRPKIRERLHGAHTGVEGCLRRARETVYWPGMNADCCGCIL